MPDPQGADTSIQVIADGDAAAVKLIGQWSIRGELPAPEPSVAEVEKLGSKRVRYDASGIGHWDSGLLIFLIRFEELLKERGVEIDRAGLPDGVRGMLHLAEAVPEREGARGS